MLRGFGRYSNHWIRMTFQRLQGLNDHQKRIADRLGLTKGTVSRQIDAAVAAGLMTVKVAPHTRRENAVALTRAGTSLVRRGDALMRDSRTAMLGAVTSTRLHAVVGALGSLLQALEQDE
jgi:DNA-binding MarR family transcriptional regulator